jgi:omega-6 fatty acid desaturase (delta-12 desaturase)
MSLNLSLAAYGLGTRLFGTLSPVFHLLLGWPLYPLFGITGGEEYGTPTSHFWCGSPFGNGRRPLFPGACKPLMRYLNRELVAMLLALFLAAIQFSPVRVLCLYGLPYLVINAWLATPCCSCAFPI